MRLPTDARNRFSARIGTPILAIGLTALLAACGRGGSDIAPLASAAKNPANAVSGPSADYPVVVGEPYSIDGTLYTPRDVMNYDEVGYAVSDSGEAQGVTIAHRTLPMPSYVEITSLDTGKTIVARVERRGPMSGGGVAALSRDALAQLEVAGNAPIRIRRVNAPEQDRAKLRVGETAPLRMETPKSLLAVLKRKLPEQGAVSLATAMPTAPQATQLASGFPGELPPKTAQAVPAPAPAAAQPVPQARPVETLARTSVEQAFDAGRQVVKSYPLPPLETVSAAMPAPVRVASRHTAPMPTNPAPQTANIVSSAPKPEVSSAAAQGAFVVQAAAFSNKANAEKLASSIDGFVEQSGRFYRVRKGPFVNRGQAEAALAKIRAAGYSDAKVYTAG